MCVDAAPQFENKDLLGTTTSFTGTVGTSPVSVPAVAGTNIAELFIKCDIDNTPTKRLYFSLDGGTTWHKLAPGDFFGWSLKNSITQVQLQGSAASVAYEVILNREPA